MQRLNLSNLFFFFLFLTQLFLSLFMYTAEVHHCGCLFWTVSLQETFPLSHPCERSLSETPWGFSSDLQQTLIWTRG